MALHCPSTTDAIIEQSGSHGCNDTFKYHCLRDKENQLVEKCLEISWIQKGKCAVYDTEAQKVDAWKCRGDLGICPQKLYLSNEVMSYSACVNSQSLIPTSSPERKLPTQTFTSKPPSDDNNVQPWIWVLIAVAALLVTVAIFVMCVIINKRRKRSSDMEIRRVDDEEMVPLGNSTESDENPCVKRQQKQHGLDSYYKTRTYEYLEKLIGDSAVSILIVGEPGSGKSVLAEMLYRRYRRQTVNGKYHVSQYLKSLEDIDKNPKEKEGPGHGNPKIIYIIDDCFEIWEQYPHLATANLKELQEVHERLVIIKGNCLVITISKINFEKNLNAAQKTKLKIIDLSSREFDLDITDKVGILEYHRYLKRSTSRRMGDEVIRKVAASSAIQSITSYLSVDCKFEFQFPLSCCLFYIHDSFEEKREMFFVETKKKTRDFVEKLLTGTHVEKCQYCSLIYIALHGGKIHAMKKKNRTFLQDIAEVAQIESSVDFNFECCLITKRKDDYEIVHEEITRQLFRLFGYVHTGFVIERCDEQVLLKFLRTDDKSRRDEYRKMGFLIITNNLYYLLATKFLDMDLEVQRHAIFQDAGFDKKFRELINLRISSKKEYNSTIQLKITQ